MPTLSNRLLNIWLDSAVPSSLDEMEDYQKALAQVSGFATTLDTLKWPGVEGLHEWVSSAPRIWLNKRRETALDSTRLQLSLGRLTVNISIGVRDSTLALQSVLSQCFEILGHLRFGT
jgi:centromere/kinetochore protein ZW10